MLFIWTTNSNVELQGQLCGLIAFIPYPGTVQVGIFKRCIHLKTGLCFVGLGIGLICLIRPLYLSIFFLYLFHTQRFSPKSFKLELSNLENIKTMIFIYSRLSLSRTPRGSLKYIEIPVLRPIRFPELRKKSNNQISQIHM